MTQTPQQLGQIYKKVTPKDFYSEINAFDQKSNVPSQKLNTWLKIKSFDQKLKVYQILIFFKIILIFLG